MFSDGYEVICSWVGNLKSVFGLSSAEEHDVKQFCDRQLPDGELRADLRLMNFDIRVRRAARLRYRATPTAITICHFSPILGSPLAGHLRQHTGNLEGLASSESHHSSGEQWSYYPPRSKSS